MPFIAFVGLFFIAVLVGFEKGSTNAFAAVLFGIPIAASIGWAIFKFSAQSALDGIERRSERLNRTNIDSKDAMYSYRLLRVNELMPADVDSAFLKEAQASTFSAAPYSERIVNARLSNSSFEDCQDALNFAVANQFISPSHAQIIQDNIDSKVTDLEENISLVKSR